MPMVARRSSIFTCISWQAGRRLGRPGRSALDLDLEQRELGTGAQPEWWAGVAETAAHVERVPRVGASILAMDVTATALGEHDGPPEWRDLAAVCVSREDDRRTVRELGDRVECDGTVRHDDRASAPGFRGSGRGDLPVVGCSGPPVVETQQVHGAVRVVEADAVVDEKTDAGPLVFLAEPPEVAFALVLPVAERGELAEAGLDAGVSRDQRFVPAVVHGVTGDAQQVGLEPVGLVH